MRLWTSQKNCMRNLKTDIFVGPRGADLVLRGPFVFGPGPLIFCPKMTDFMGQIMGQIIFMGQIFVP